MHLTCHSLTFRNADTATRQRVHVSGSHRGTVLRRLHLAHPEALLLCTCNRVEIYTFDHASGPSPVQTLARVLDLPEMADPLPWECWTDTDAVFHLLKLACGLESMVIGETEVFRQLKHAYADAVANGTAGSQMHQLFQRVFSVAKRIRTGTDLGRFRVSVAGVAVDWLLGRLPDPSTASVAVWGTGAVGRAVVHALARAGVPGGVVLGHRLHPARLLARGWGGRAGEGTAAREVLATCDAFISCTAAPHPVLEASLLPPQRAPLHLMDLAIPRDIAEDVRERPYVHLMDLDALQGIAEEGAASREAVRDQLLPGLQAEAEVLWACLGAKRQDRCLARWREEVKRDLDREVERLLSESPSLSEAEHDRMRRLAGVLLQRMLDRPSRALRDAIRAGLPCVEHLPEMASFATPNCQQDTGDDTGRAGDSTCKSSRLNG